MNIIVSAQSAHWTDEQLIDHLYGIGPTDGHLNQCEECASRLSAMETRRQQVSPEEAVSDQFLAAQRRAIYARMSDPQHWWTGMMGRRWVTAAAATVFAVLLGSGGLYQHRLSELAQARADAQLAQDVSQMSFESESSAMAPLRGLFVE